MRRAADYDILPAEKRKRKIFSHAQPKFCTPVLKTSFHSAAGCNGTSALSLLLP